MKKLSILILLIVAIYAACEEIEEEPKREPEQEIDNRLGTFTGEGDLIYYDLYGEIESSYKNMNITVKVKNHVFDEDSYNVNIDYPSKGTLNLQVQKKDISIQDENYKGTLILSSSKCSGTVSIYNKTTGKKSSSYSWSSAK